MPQKRVQKRGCGCRPALSGLPQPSQRAGQGSMAAGVCGQGVAGARRERAAAAAAAAAPAGRPPAHRQALAAPDAGHPSGKRSHDTCPLEMQTKSSQSSEMDILWRHGAGMEKVLRTWSQ